MDVCLPDGRRAIVRDDVNGRLQVRLYGLVERMCEHGVGHPIGHRVRWLSHDGIHGCDGCCNRWRAEQNLQNNNLPEDTH